MSPHPDDEAISGALAIRLSVENHCPVTNVAVTLGSDPKRRVARKKELARALKLLKWKGVALPEDWSAKERALVTFFMRQRPAVVLAPHPGDRHPTHVRTAKLVRAALKRSGIDTTVAWAEYWAPQPHPNALVEVTPEILTKQLRALACHAGEVARNPYHLRLPGWMMDNVRRGSEWLGGKGAPAAPFVYGQLYRLERWEKGKPVRRKPAVTPFQAAQDDLSDFFA